MLWISTSENVIYCDLLAITEKIFINEIFHFSGDKRYYSTRKVGDVPIIVRGRVIN